MPKKGRKYMMMTDEVRIASYILTIAEIIDGHLRQPEGT
jgi:hypothetical protein